MTKRRTHGPISVRHIASGETWDVPRDIYTTGKAASWIEQQIQDRDAAARAAQETAKAREVDNINQSLRVTELEALIAQQGEVIARLEEQNKRLEQASPEAAAGAMALMSATAQAQQLRTDLQKDMGAIAEWRQKYNEDVSVVADEVRRKNATLDSEKQERLERNRRLFDELRMQQGLKPQFPELVQTTEEATDGEA